MTASTGALLSDQRWGGDAQCATAVASVREFRRASKRPYELTLEFLASKQTEKLNVVSDQHAAITTVVTDQRIKEMPVERAESIGASHNCSVDDWIVVGVGRHDTRSGAREYIL
jgi:hypothetical protein